MSLPEPLEFHRVHPNLRLLPDRKPHPLVRLWEAWAAICWYVLLAVVAGAGFLALTSDQWLRWWFGVQP